MLIVLMGQIFKRRLGKVAKRLDRLGLIFANVQMDLEIDTS